MGIPPMSGVCFSRSVFGLVRRCSTNSAVQSVHVASLRETYASHEYERQIFARFQDCEARRIISYEVTHDVQEAWKYTKMKADFVKHFGTGGFKADKLDVLPTVGTKVETDLYLTLDLADSEESSKALVMDIMKGVCEEHVWLNPPKSTTNGDVELRSGDSVWIEITEKPSCIPAKLWQLERACIAICALTATKTKAEDVLPNALVVCVNGEWEVAKQVAENIKKQINNCDGLWHINRIPTLVVWAPFRNVYSSLGALDRKINGLESSINGLESSINGLEEGQKLLSSKINGLEEGQKLLSSKINGLE